MMTKNSLKKISPKNIHQLMIVPLFNIDSVKIVIDLSILEIIIRIMATGICGLALFAHTTDSITKENLNKLNNYNLKNQSNHYSSSLIYVNKTLVQGRTIL